ncbi:hypothetical protein FKM82_021314 [Ascaphus truei]
MRECPQDRGSLCNHRSPWRCNRCPGAHRIRTPHAPSHGAPEGACPHTHNRPQLFRPRGASDVVQNESATLAIGDR